MSLTAGAMEAERARGVSLMAKSASPSRRPATSAGLPDWEGRGVGIGESCTESSSGGGVHTGATPTCSDWLSYLYRFGFSANKTMTGVFFEISQVVVPVTQWMRRTGGDGLDATRVVLSVQRQAPLRISVAGYRHDF